jgi:tRNA-dihydrouridine synthase A
MIDWTNTHFRVFMRLLAPQALLYTDMQTAGAVFNNPLRALDFHPMEEPVALQLGGSDKTSLMKCAQLAEERGFSEINLNLGCPSDRVQAGRFGACLMAEPQTVVDCIKAIKQVVNIPVSAKVRIGIDQQDSYDFFSDFVHQIVDAGCDKIIVHARKAWLHGLNPKQNRTIPPLHYDYVYKIKQELVSTPVIINGNITNLEGIHQHLKQVDGVMLGRLACQNPYAIAIIHNALYPEQDLLKRSIILERYINYIQSLNPISVPISVLIKPLFTFAHGLSGSRAWKALLMEILQQKNPKLLFQCEALLKELE